MMKAAQEHAAGHDRAVIVAGTGRRSDTELRLVRSLATNVDGFVVSSGASPASLLRLSASGRPLVSVGPEGDPDLDIVVSDVDIAALTLDHLWSLGHRHVAIVEGPPGLDSTARRSGAAQAWAARHVGAQLELIGGWDGNVREGFAAADVVAELMPSGVTAAVAYCDAVAFGMLMRLVARRIRVPAELSLIGVDDVELASFVPGGLTTVDLGASGMAKAAVDAVLGLVPAAAADLPSPVVVARGTTGPPRQGWPTGPGGLSLPDGDRTR